MSAALENFDDTRQAGIDTRTAEPLVHYFGIGTDCLSTYPFFFRSFMIIVSSVFMFYNR